MNTAAGTTGRAESAPTSVALKVAMAITGLVMAAWLTLHMLGNLTMFAGPALMNAYALKLRDTGLLWPMRLGLVVIALVHIGCAVVTTRRARGARPRRYQFAPRLRAADWASRSMRTGGALLLFYLLYHVAHLYGVGHASYVPGDVYHNLVSALREPLHAALYLVATLLMTSHLAHGLGSALITLGWFPAQRQVVVKRALQGWMWLVTGGFTFEVVAGRLLTL